MFQNRRGFTLIEVLVAVSIMSLLSVLILVKMDDSRARARDSRRLSDIKQIQIALESYRVNTGAYPLAITPGQSLISGSMTYLEQIPSNPTPMNEGFCPEQNYLYRQQESGASYSLSFCLSDKTLDYSAGYNAAWPNSEITSSSDCVNGCINNNICKNSTCTPCPKGYIAVPGNSALGTKDFCVMKYEARSGPMGAVSEAASPIWVNIGNVSANMMCNMNGSDFRLITNEEWLTIAINIENVASNWSSRKNGEGFLNVGWVEVGNVAPQTNNACLYVGITMGDCRKSGDFKYKRTHKLSNNQEIWDFGGNVAELTNSSTNGLYDSGGDFFDWSSDLLTKRELNLLGPIDMTAFNVTKNYGKYHSGHGASGYIIRGGSYGWLNTGGIYGVNIDQGLNDNGDTSLGFRCVYQ